MLAETTSTSLTIKTGRFYGCGGKKGASLGGGAVDKLKLIKAEGISNKMSLIAFLYLTACSSDSTGNTIRIEHISFGGVFSSGSAIMSLYPH